MCTAKYAPTRTCAHKRAQEPLPFPVENLAIRLITRRSGAQASRRDCGVNQVAELVETPIANSIKPNQQRV